MTESHQDSDAFQTSGDSPPSVRRIGKVAGVPTNGLATIKKQIQERFAVVHDSLAGELGVVAARRPLADIAAPILKVVERRLFNPPVRNNVHIIALPTESAEELIAQLEQL